MDEPDLPKGESQKPLQSTSTSILSLSRNCSISQGHLTVLSAEVLAPAEYKTIGDFQPDAECINRGLPPHSTYDSIRLRCGRKRSRHFATNKHWSAVASTYGASTHDHANTPCRLVAKNCQFTPCPLQINCAWWKRAACLTKHGTAAAI